MGSISDWTALLATVDPSTQEVASPFPDPYVPDPTMTDTTGALIHLNPLKWATWDCAQQVAQTLGGKVTLDRPAWDPPPIGVGFGQPHFYVTFDPAVVPFMKNATTDPADLANMFPGNLAELKQDLPEFLGIVAGG